MVSFVTVFVYMTRHMEAFLQGAETGKSTVGNYISSCIGAGFRDWRSPFTSGRGVPVIPLLGWLAVRV